MRLRRSGKASRSAKAENFDYEEDGVLKIKAFQELFLPRVLTNVPEPLRSRLSVVITDRRRFFEYQRRHGKKLAYGFDVIESERASAVPTQDAPRQWNGRPHAHNSRGSQALRPAVPISGMSKGGLSVLSSTVASVVDSKVDQIPPRSTIVPSFLPSTSFRTHNRIGDAPPMAKGATHFECPHCAVQLPKKKRDKNSWR